MGKIALASINIDFCLWNSLPQDPVETWGKKSLEVVAPLTVLLYQSIDQKLGYCVSRNNIFVVSLRKKNPN